MSDPMSKTIDEIDEMFDLVLMEVDGPAVGFLEGLHEQWEEKKWLSEKQIAALEKFYDRCQGDQ